MTSLLNQGEMIMKEHVAYVGIDWSSTKHDITVSIDGIKKRYIIKHGGAEIRSFFFNLYKEVKGNIAVCVETKTGPLCSVLYELDYITLYPINPLTLSKMRRAFSPSGSKDDPTDADLICDILLLHRDRLRAVSAPTKESHQLDLLTRHRRQLVDQYTGLTNQLRDILKNYYPLFLNLFDDFTTKVCLDFLEQWSNLKVLQKATDEEILSFLCSRSSSNKNKNQKRISLIRGAKEFLNSNTQGEVLEKVSKHYVAQLRTLRESIKALESDISKALVGHEDLEIIRSLPQTGDIHAARLIGALSHTYKWCNGSEELANYLGVSPIIIRSGNTNIIRSRKARPMFYHQSIIEWAASTRFSCAWARKLYDTQRARGKSHFSAVRALAFKWIRIVYACLQNRTNYCDDLYKKKLKMA